MGTNDFFSNPTSVTALSLEERNRLAQQTIDVYVRQHIAMDIGLWGVSLIPGAGIPALMVAIGAQAPIIYQPLAKKLAKIYLVTPDELEHAQEDKITSLVITNAAADIAADFGVEFIKLIAKELLLEAGFGAAVGTWLPIVGAFVAAGLDYYIAKKMTNRVGRMVAFYFQNGVQWSENGRKATYEVVKNLDSLDDIRKINSVRETLLRNLRPMITMMRQAGSTPDQIRRALQASNVPSDLIDKALSTT